MANYCNLRTETDVDKKKILTSLVNELKNKYNLESKYSIEPTSKASSPEFFINFKIKGLIFPFWISPKNIEFYDVPATAFERHNNDNKKNEYVAQYYNQVDFKYPRIFIYALIYDYIKQFLATQLNVEVDSDGSGPFIPFSEKKEKYNNATNWFKYWEKLFSSTEIKKYSKREKSFFPEFYE